MPSPSDNRLHPGELPYSGTFTGISATVIAIAPEFKESLPSRYASRFDAGAEQLRWSNCPRFQSLSLPLIVDALSGDRSVMGSRHGNWDIAFSAQLMVPVAKGVCQDESWNWRLTCAQ